jgi:hypothetical protein
LWEVASAGAGPRFEEEKAQIASLAFSPDGRTLAAGCQDGTVQLWEVSSGQKRRSFTGHRDQVITLAFSPDGFRLASGSADTTALVWDVRRLPPSAPAKGERPKTEKLLEALRSLDAAVAYRAVCQLAEVPGSSLTQLRKQLQPVPLPDAKQIERWLADLDSKDFKARQQAFAELAKHGDGMEAVLRKALAERPTLEKRQRLEQLLERLHPSRSPGRLFVLRGVEVLERSSAPQARKMLEELAQLPQGYLVAREAKAALERLASQQSAAATP